MVWPFTKAKPTAALQQNLAAPYEDVEVRRSSFSSFRKGKSDASWEQESRGMELKEQSEEVSSRRSEDRQRRVDSGYAASTTDESRSSPAGKPDSNLVTTDDKAESKGRKRSGSMLSLSGLLRKTPA